MFGVRDFSLRAFFSSAQLCDTILEKQFVYILSLWAPMAIFFRIKGSWEQSVYPTRKTNSNGLFVFILRSWAPRAILAIRIVTCLASVSSAQLEYGISFETCYLWEKELKQCISECMSLCCASLSGQSHMCVGWADRAIFGLRDPLSKSIFQHCAILRQKTILDD